MTRLSLAVMVAVTGTGCATPRVDADDEPEMIEPIPLAGAPAPPSPVAEPVAPSLAAEPVAPAPSVESLAMMPLRCGFLPADKRAAVDRLLVTALSARGAFRVITAADLDALLGLERLKDVAGCTDVGCFADVAGALDARYVAYATLDDLAGAWRFTLTLLDTRAGQVDARAEVEADRAEAVLPAATEVLVARLLGAPVEPGRVQTPTPATGRRAAIAVYARLEGSSDPVSTANVAVAKALETATMGEAQALGYELVVPPVVQASADPLAVTLGVDLARLGAADVGELIVAVGLASDTGTVMGTRMHGVRASLSLRLVEIASGRVLAASSVEEMRMHIAVERRGGVGARRAQGIRRPEISAFGCPVTRRRVASTTARLSRRRQRSGR
jgi:hypothetical protein